MVSGVFFPGREVLTVECTVINLIQHWERRRRKEDHIGKKLGFFLKVSDVKS